MGTTRNIGGEFFEAVIDPALSMQVDTGATYKYIGEAKPGTATSAARWRICRLTIATSVILYATDGEFDQIWDNRASLTYA